MLFDKEIHCQEEKFAKFLHQRSSSYDRLQINWPIEMKGLSGEPGPVALSCWALPIQRPGGSEAGRIGMATEGEAEGPRIWVQYRD